jgi:hypothetical protein
MSSECANNELFITGLVTRTSYLINVTLEFFKVCLKAGKISFLVTLFITVAIKS